jgi:ribonucleoside-triphosphate reductase
MADKECNGLTEVYSRIVGYFRPVSMWNSGKKQEFEDRKTFENLENGK